MSDRPIQVGDLVQAVRWPCCGKWLGMIFRVNAFKGVEAGERLGCSNCGVAMPEVSQAYDVWSIAGRSAPITWLKRIPPLEELEGQRTQEDIREPA